MNERRDPTGRMSYRVWYEAAEIDAIMEDELHRAGNPVLPGTIAVDIDAFVEHHLGVVPEFVNLPPGIQGATEFSRDGRVRMKIASDLAERADGEASAERLLRTTLAHEAAHVLLHRTLFLHEGGSLFGDEPNHEELCRDIRFVGTGYHGEWWEWQANRGMGALLLPRARAIREVQRCRAASGGDASAADLEEILARAFAVSRIAARYRLQQLNIVSDPRQGKLDLL